MSGKAKDPEKFKAKQRAKDSPHGRPVKGAKSRRKHARRAPKPRRVERVLQNEGRDQYGRIVQPMRKEFSRV